MPWLEAPSTSIKVPTQATSAGDTSATPDQVQSRNEALARLGHESIDAPGAQTGNGIEDSGMMQVLDSLQHVRNLDPAAEQHLISRLREAPVSSWPLVAEQFRASLAYREQLAAKQETSRAIAPAGEGAGESRISAIESLTTKPPLGIDLRPSTPLGALADPRNAESDGVSSEAMARSTPYSTPVPSGNSGVRPLPNASTAPDYFASDGPAYPIVAATSDDIASAIAGRTEAIVQAGFISPLDSTRAGDWKRLIESAADELSQNTPESPTTTAEVHQLVTLRVLRLLSGDTDQALEAIPHLSPTEQDYWSRQMFALATYLDHHAQPDVNRRAAASVIHLDEAVASLRELGSLALRNLSFCKKVYGYGAIDAYEADRFSPGEQVSLYVEVENYHSRSTENGYCTSLGSTYEILNNQGDRIGGGTMPDVDDCCRSRRRDFHIQYGITLPKTLEPGQYHLNLIVKDRQRDKIGHASVDFEILSAAP